MNKASETYEQFLLNKHSKFKTPTALISRIISKALGSKLIASQKIIAGEVNEVYSITTNDKKEYILRISHALGPRFKEEKFALDKSREQAYQPLKCYIWTKFK